MGSSPAFLDPVILPLIEGPKVLDVGCGFGRWGALLTTNYWETSWGASAGRPSIYGCDGYRPNVELVKASGFYAEVHHIVFPPLPFSSNSFDTVLLIDVIEHLIEENGLKLIGEAKRVASKRVILSTPNWSAIREAHATMTGWNCFEAHLSYWPRVLLRRLGFRLYGAGWRSNGRYWRGILRRTGLLSFHDRVIRKSLMSLSLYLPFLAENVVGIWEKE